MICHAEAVRSQMVRVATRVRRLWWCDCEWEVLEGGGTGVACRPKASGASDFDAKSHGSVVADG